jgi:hypothetical protein
MPCLKTSGLSSTSRILSLRAFLRAQGGGWGGVGWGGGGGGGGAQALLVALGRAGVAAGARRALVRVAHVHPGVERARAEPDVDRQVGVAADLLLDPEHLVEVVQLEHLAARVDLLGQLPRLVRLHQPEAHVVARQVGGVLGVLLHAGLLRGRLRHGCD